MKKKGSLQTTIFLNMILLVVIGSFIVFTVTIMEYKKRAEQYHYERFLYKENQIKTQIQYVLSGYSLEASKENLYKIFKREVYQIANIQNVSFNLYDLQGSLIISSNAFLDEKSLPQCLPDSILEGIDLSQSKRVVSSGKRGEDKYQSSYSYFMDNQFKPLGVLNIPYFENDSFNEKSLQTSLKNLLIVYVVLLGIAIFSAYILSKYIAKNLKHIEQILIKAEPLKKNEKITLEGSSTEIDKIIEAYNSMVEQLEINKEELSKMERERAWREMAQQVAHEIKNPLTPMKLTVQNFQRKFDQKDPDVQKKVDYLCNTLVQHIDSLSEVTSTFSYLTSIAQNEYRKIDINELIKNCVQIFEQEIIFETNCQSIYVYVDVNQFNRVITNLVKNAIQATEGVKEPKVEIYTKAEESIVMISVKDNGVGISEDNLDRIFEPKFTTKTNGTGTGLAVAKSIVKSHQGYIEASSKEGEGSEFRIFLSINRKV